MMKGRLTKSSQATRHCELSFSEDMKQSRHAERTTKTVGFIKLQAKFLSITQATFLTVIALTMLWFQPAKAAEAVLDDAVIKSAEKIILEKSSPNPVETIITSGNQLDGKGEKNTSEVAKDADKTFILAQAFTATNKPMFLSAARQFLLAWATTNKASPDAIANTNLERMIRAYIILKPYLKDDTVNIENWLNSIASEMIKFHNSKTPDPQRHDGLETIFNNHHSHFLKTILLIGYATNNRDYINYVKTEFPAQINRSFSNADGSGIDFDARDSVRYHAYSLQELLKVGRLLSEHGDIDYNPYTLVTESGASLKRAVQFLIPFSITGLGAKQHIEYANSQNFDKDSGENRDIKRNGTPEYDAKYSVPVFENAAYFDSQFSSEKLPSIE